MSDPLAGYTTDWRKRMEEDPLAGYTPDWRSRSDLGPDRRLESARGRREVEYETIQRQLEQYRKSMATAVGERRNRLERQIAGLEQEVSPFGLAATGGESLKRFGGGVLAGPSQMVLTLADLAAAPLQIAEGVVGRDAQWGRGIRNWIQEQQATIEEVTGSRGPEGLVGNLVGGIAGGVLQGITKGVPVLRLLTRGANIGGEGYARLANATLRFAGRAKPLEPFARASFEGGRLARAGGNIAADLPWNVVQIASADDMSTQDVLRSLGLSAVGAGVGGALSPKIPYKRPTFKPDLSDLGGNSRANADAHAQSMADQMEKIRIWQDAHPDKKWNDLSAEERAAVVGSDPATASKAVVKANEHLSMLSNVLRGFLVGENDMVEAARRAYNTMIEMGATPDQIWATLGITVKNGVPVTHDGKVPTPERMDIAAGNVPREVVAEARVQSDAKTHRSQRMNDLMNKARAEARTQRQERRKAERLALMDPLIETIQGPRAWQQAQASIEADEGTYLAKFDANNFKAVNDLGQAVGDEALKTIGNTISAFANAARLRAFRIGGDEFVIAGPLDAVAQVREQLEMVLYGQEFGGQKTSVSGGIGLTLREAELDLEPRKLASKKSLGQPLSRKDTEYIEKPIHEALPTVQVFKAVNEHGLGAIVRAAGTYPDSKRIRDFKPDVDPELVLTNAIEIETAARSVLGQWLEMSAAGIAPDKIRRVLARQYGLGDGGSEAVTRMPRPGVSRPTGDVSRPDVGGGPAPEAGPGTRGANRNVTDLRAAAQEAEDLWMHLQRTFPAPTRAQQKRIDFAEAQMRKARKAADLTEMPLQRVPVGEPPLRQGPETAPGVEPTDLATIEVTKRIKKNKLEPQVRQAAEDIASQTGDEPHINTEMAARSVLRQFEDHIASGLSPDEARARIDADTRDNLADPEVERVHPIQKELDNVPAMKAKWNALEDALEDLDPETAEFAKVQAEADALWAKIEALDGFSEAGAPTAEPRPATVSSPEPPAGTTPTPADPLQLETIRLPAPLAELGPNEIEGIIDNMLAPFDRNPELVGTKSWEQVQRDSLKLRERWYARRSSSLSTIDALRGASGGKRLLTFCNSTFSSVSCASFI